MAESSLFPKNGAVSLGSMVADFNNFRIVASQMVENVTPYGAGVAAKNVGNGTPDFDYTIGAFGLKGASNTAPGLVSNFTTANSALTLTLDTGCTEATNMVFSRITVEHSRMRAAVPMTIEGKVGDQTQTETWATS